MLQSLATWSQGATPFRFTQNEHMQYFEKGAIRSCLKQSASLRKPNECAEIACVYTRLLQGAKLADSAQPVCVNPWTVVRSEDLRFVKNSRMV